ncbi:uncharacterized protein [Amphiura filiformis]|uniref:uncharacterized protein n=1 Tax=Amphiura filiformis TaxID=82378 RepID=UPI003B213D1A
MLHSLACEMYIERQNDIALTDYLDPFNGQMRTLVFFMLPKVHKTPPQARLVGRPVVSNCSSPLEKASSIRTHRLLPSTSGEIPTHLPEGYRRHHQEDRNLTLPQGIILASLDVVSMFTSVPQDQAFRVILEALANLDLFDSIIPDMKYMAELLRLVLYRNSFEFNNEYFLQTSGVPMGQRSIGSNCP